MRFCPSCGSRVSEDARFCPSCGTTLSGNQISSKNSGMIPPFLSGKTPKNNNTTNSTNKLNKYDSFFYKPCKANASFSIPQLESSKNEKRFAKPHFNFKIIGIILLILAILGGGAYLGNEGVKASKINDDNFMLIGSKSVRTYDDVKDILGSGKLVVDNTSAYDIYEWSSIFTKKVIIVRFNDGKYINKDKDGTWPE